MQTRLLNTLKYHLERLPAAVEAEQAHDRERIAEALASLESSADETREELALRKRLPALVRALAERRLPADYELLLRDLESCLRARPRERGRAAAPSPVEQVAALLRGRVLVVVGGVPQVGHAEKLRKAFELSAVSWPATNEHAPDVAALEPEIARADVAAVVLLIRWIRHAMNDLDEVCRRHDKPLVRMPGGYNVNQIAANVLAQVSKRLDGG
jgi:hypothetical protein